MRVSREGWSNNCEQIVVLYVDETVSGVSVLLLYGIGDANEAHGAIMLMLHAIILAWKRPGIRYC